MLPLKLVRSLVFGDTINNNPLLHSTDNNTDKDDDDTNRNVVVKTPLLLFLPTKELVTDTYRLATIARDMGMDLHPTPSLSHIILTYPPPPPPPPPQSSWSPSSSSSSSSSPCILWSSFSLSSTCPLPDNAVPLPFPCLISAPIGHLHAFVRLSRGFFKLVFAPSDCIAGEPTTSHWNCCSVSLFLRLAGCRIDSMEGFSRALAGIGWTLFKTATDSGGGKSVYLFRKVDMNRVRGGECRIRELRLPALDFRNAPLRILQYILLMTDDIFYLA